MLQIVIPRKEHFNDETGRFFWVKETPLTLEHSLVSLSKWESKWKKPFHDGKPKTWEESIDYIRCMTITQNVDPMVYMGITSDILDTVHAYIDEPMTATTFRTINEGKKRGGRQEIITAEIIYYWMFSYSISMECQKWHLNRLMTLIRVFDIKNSPPKKMSRRETLRHNQAQNAARRKRLNTRG